MEDKILVIIIGVILALFFLFKKGDAGKQKDDTVTPASQATEQDVLEALKFGNKIEAIKYYRNIHKVGIKEAKEAVDKLEANL